MPTEGPKGKKYGDPSQRALYALEVLVGIRPEEYDHPPKDEAEAEARRRKDEWRRKRHDDPPSEERTTTLSGSGD